MNTNNNILDDIDDREDMDEDELLRQQQNTWTMCIEHDGGGARRDVHPPPPRLIPLSSISKEGIEASEIRMKMMKYEAVFAAAAAKEQRYDGCCRAVGVKICWHANNNR